MSCIKTLSRIVGVCGIATALYAQGAAPVVPCRIDVVDGESRWPVPLVELQTNHAVSLVSDNAGRVAFDLPELMDREVWLSVTSDGYEVPADGFGMRGVRVTPRSGTAITIEVHRTSIAKRLGRVTGAGQFGESQKLGLETDWQESGALGSDSVQNAVHNGRLFWAWGDTNLAHYPLGIFDMSSATTDIQPLTKFEPPLRIRLNYFRDTDGRPRGVAKMPGAGPTWLSGYASLPDKTGRARLVATYVKVKPPLETYEAGLCVWNEKTECFEHLRTEWVKGASSPDEPPMPHGHPAIVDGKDNRKWVVFGDPLPKLRCPATFEAWQDRSQWEVLRPQETIASAVDGTPVKPASGSLAWNSFRKRWVTIFMQAFGTPSAFGEVWYAEADSPYGPWGPAVKVLSHRNYSFYNPRLHPEFSPLNSPILLFEGTYSQTFANKPVPTPRYDYNQIMYRLDLDDPQLAAARKTGH